jgi:hypothetical protein
MKICEDGHPKLICEDACPACELNDKRLMELAILQEKINSLEGTIESKSAVIEEYRKELGL